MSTTTGFFHRRIDQVVERFLKECDRLNIHCTVETTLTVVPSHPHEVATVVWHLMTNSIAHARRSTGVIEVLLVTIGGVNTLTVIDNFGGLDEDKIRQVANTPVTKRQLPHLIMSPGFTTRPDQHDKISGGGHGLNQVAKLAFQMDAQPPTLHPFEGGLQVKIRGISAQ